MLPDRCIFWCCC